MQIRAKDIVKSYTKQQRVTPVLKGVSLSVDEGEFISIIGPSGAGKSTLLHILGGLDSPDSGSLIIEHEDVYYDFANMSANELAAFRNKNIGFIFQFHHLLPEFSAIENIMLPALIAGESYKNAKSRAIDLLKMLNLDLREMHKPMELSGGEQQRIAIARALINSPMLILADEPTGNLDHANSLNILDILDSLKQKTNSTFIIATHSDAVASRSQRVITIIDGKEA